MNVRVKREEKENPTMRQTKLISLDESNKNKVRFV